MISSCAQCTTKCCKSGPGPYKEVSAVDWLSMKQKGSDRYNTRCENFDEEEETCRVWDTTSLPIACKVFVCGVRTYTKKELALIDFILEEEGWK